MDKQMQAWGQTMFSLHFSPAIIIIIIKYIIK